MKKLIHFFVIAATIHTITVKAQTIPADLPVTGNLTQPAPVITESHDTLISNMQTGNQWYFESGQIQGVTGLKSVQNPGIKIYPVPNDGLFTVSVTNFPYEAITIGVYNNMGFRILEKQDITLNGNLDETINLPSVSGGVYIVRIGNAQRQFVKRIIVNK